MLLINVNAGWKHQVHSRTTDGVFCSFGWTLSGGRSYHSDQDWQPWLRGRNFGYGLNPFVILHFAWIAVPFCQTGCASENFFFFVKRQSNHFCHISLQTTISIDNGIQSIHNQSSLFTVARDANLWITWFSSTGEVTIPQPTTPRNGTISK